jgi:hypothetical protein
MMRQRSLWLVVGGMAILFFGRELNAGTVIFGAHSGPHAGIGVWIGTPAPAPMCRPPMHERVIVTRPWHHPPVHVMPPYRDVVVVRPPVVERVIIEPQPPVIVQSPAPVVVEGTVEVWITNSNGSRTAVKVTRQGPWYIGPRGEYYTDMPTNEQLRVVYGF